MAAEIFEQNTGLRRNIIDKYYTKNSVVLQCINFIRQHLQISINDLIIEPSAGNGAFINPIKTLTNNYLFYDLEPEHNEIIQQDFLEFDYRSVRNQYVNQKIHIIGNPPFGRQSSIAIKFIRNACSFCDTLSFILPKSFKKESMKNKIPLNFHLLFEIDIEPNGFLVDNVEHDVPCVFQIWKKQNDVRVIPNRLIPINFEFVNKTDNPDISFRRVGINAGTMSTQIDNKSIQTHYFIKFINGLSINENLERLNNIQFQENNTVGPKSISKQELTSIIDHLL